MALLLLDEVVVNAIIRVLPFFVALVWGAVREVFTDSP
jgi:hypothetical protein